MDAEAFAGGCGVRLDDASRGKRTQDIAQGQGTLVQKRMYDPQLGWREASVRQLTVQDDLVARLTRDRPTEDG